MGKGGGGDSRSDGHNHRVVRPVLSKCPLHTNGGCGKREAHINWSMGTCQGSTRYWNYLEVYWPCAGGLIGSERHRYAIARPDKLGTGPMAYGGLNKQMDAAAELGRNPASKHQAQPEYGDEQADAGRGCQTHLARPNSQARTRTGKYSFSLFS